MRRDNNWEPPETMQQARTWETVKNRYLAASLCVNCASQAAYGHQLGFSRIHPPCGDCTPVVAGFPIQATTVWRRLRDARRRVPRPFPQNWRSETRARDSDADSQGRQDSGDQPVAAAHSESAVVPSEAAP